VTVLATAAARFSGKAAATALVRSSGRAEARSLVRAVGDVQHHDDSMHHDANCRGLDVSCGDGWIMKLGGACCLKAEMPHPA